MLNKCENLITLKLDSSTNIYIKFPETLGKIYRDLKLEVLKMDS